VTLDPTMRPEQQGHRPVLIISASAFNDAAKLPVVLPITNSGDFASRIGFGVELSNLKTTGLVRCDHMRVLDITALGGRFVESLPAALINDVMAKVVTIFE
jgi:mRNA-degrading endonuclease toxin of MazEF toxin-antitoxin module